MQKKVLDEAKPRKVTASQIRNTMGHNRHVYDADTPKEKRKK